MPTNPFIIDENDLAAEWLRQPSLMRKAGVFEAECRRDHDHAKAHLAVIHARLYLEIKRNPGDYGLSNKPPKDTVNAAVQVEETYIAAVDKVNKAKYDLDVATADTTAMIDRRKALERLVELIALNYYSEKEPQARSSKGREEIKDRTRRAIRGEGYDG